MKEVIDRVIKREGGFVVDHAGPTNFGITLPPYQEFKGHVVSHNDIRDMTRQEATAFYEWLFTKENISGIKDQDLLDLLFDCMVNHGNSRAIKWVQEIVGVSQDGVCGPITTAALNIDPRNTYLELIKKRVKFYAGLATANPTKYLRFLKGWINRACEFIKDG